LSIITTITTTNTIITTIMIVWLLSSIQDSLLPKDCPRQTKRWLK